MSDIENKEVVIEEPKQAFASFNEYQMMYLNTQYPNGLSSFANFTIPRDYINQVKKAKELRDIDIVDRLIRIRQDYTLPIKGFKCKAKRQQKFYNDVVLPLIQNITNQWVLEHNSVGDVYGHYGFKPDGKTPMFFEIEDGESITPVSALGIEFYKVKLSLDLKEQLKKILNQDRKLISSLPDYLRKAVVPSDNGDNYLISDEITLFKENMNRSTNQKQNYQLRSKPPLLRIMKSLMLREFLIDVDYSTAFSMGKSSIIHVQCGSEKEPIKDDKLLKSIHDLITNRPPGQMTVTTRGDIKISAVDLKMADMFDPKRFQECNKRILDYFGISVAFVPSVMADVNNAIASVSTKPFQESIQTDRKIFEKFVQPFFEEINRKNNYNEIPSIEYDINGLNSDELLKVLQFLFNCGVVSYQDLCSLHGYDYEEQLVKKEWDQEHKFVIRPWFEASQGLLQDEEQAKIDNGENNKSDLKNQKKISAPKNNQT